VTYKEARKKSDWKRLGRCLGGCDRLATVSLGRPKRHDISYRMLKVCSPVNDLRVPKKILIAKQGPAIRVLAVRVLAVKVLGDASLA
jgi:hypothetical protein